MAARNSKDRSDAVSTAQEAPALESTVAETQKHGFFVRLYTGTGAFNVIGRRKLWFAISGLILAIAIASIAIRGFTFGIDFEGGTKVSIPVAGATGMATVQQVEDVFAETIGEGPQSVVMVGSGDSASVQIRSETLTNDQTEQLRTALFDRFQPKGTDGQPSRQSISDSAVSETWGDQITNKMLLALVVFVVAVAIYIAVWYERYMAIAALTAMFYTIITTAGVYSLVGWEVTPATVIGLLTILGFSLYDTVVVFDKVEENTRGFEHTTRRTFAEQANLAVNQTFMRSINTSLISVLPIVALIVIAVWLLGVGMLKDLALVQLVGVFTGAYASIFFATPLLVTLRERTELVRTHTQRVMRRRKGAAAKETRDAHDTDASAATDADEAEPSAPADTAANLAAAAAKPAPDKPAPGARPTRPGASRTGRPTGKRNARRR